MDSSDGCPGPEGREASEGQREVGRLVIEDVKTEAGAASGPLTRRGVGCPRGPARTEATGPRDGRTAGQDRRTRLPQHDRRPAPRGPRQQSGTRCWATSAWKAEGKPPIRMHDLRHSKGTVMAERGRGPGRDPAYAGPCQVEHHGGSVRREGSEGAPERRRPLGCPARREAPEPSPDDSSEGRFVSGVANKAANRAAKKPRSPIWSAGPLVPKRGLEPRREYSHYALNVARLPIPPRRPAMGV